MPLPIAVRGALVICGALLSLSARAEQTTNQMDSSPLREQFLLAEQALSSGDMDRFRALSESLKNYPLAPDLAIAELLRRLSRAESEEVVAALKANAGTGPGETLRRLWLARLAREKRWKDYVRDYADNGSETRECQYRTALLQQGDTAAAFDGLARLYLSGDTLPEVCNPVLSAWADSGKLSSEQVWQRIELALVSGKPQVARYQSRYLPAADRPWLDYRLAAAQQPRLALQPPASKHSARNQVIAAALADLARREPDLALEALGSRFRDLPAAQAGIVHANAGLTLAKRGANERAREQLDKLVPGTGSLSLQRERLRAGLKLRAWKELPGWIQALPQDEQRLALWQYWLGRALEQKAAAPPSSPKQTEADRLSELKNAAQAAYARAADDRSLWGFLAAEHIGRPIKIEHRPTPISPERRAALLDSPRAARIRELRALGRDTEISREWREWRLTLDHGLRGDERRTGLQEAAVLAQALDFPRHAIFTLVPSGYWDDLELRFPVLFAKLTAQAAQDTGLAQSWILAVIRQESIFDPDIRSPVGATGLMQLMPATAREVARNHEITLSSLRDLQDPLLNIRLGSRYLATLDKLFGGRPALATAAYNAGPGAVRRWLPKQPMDADIWIATIPYAETRTYVSRVLAYRLLYADRLGQPIPNLTNMLPPVGGS